MSHLEDWKTHFENYRAYLISFAFRMTGSLSEAEDLVQDTFVECARVNPAEIENPKAWLTKVCSNKALDHLKSAYKKRETYRGPWLPDAIPDNLQAWSNFNADESRLLAAESLTTSFLLLIERLSPEERAVFLLAEVFDYPFAEIAEFLNKSEAACRKIAQRARESVINDRPRFKSAGANAVQTLERFFTAAKAGDMSALISLLAEDAQFWSDGGGKVPASPVVMRDREQIAKFWIFLGTTPAYKEAAFRIEPHRVNGLAGVVISRQIAATEWVFDTIISCEFSEDGRLARIYAQRNPEKLKALTVER